jgi:hypothetical protein
MAKYVDLKIPGKEVSAYSYFNYIGPCALERPASTTQVSNVVDDDNDQNDDDVGAGIKDGRCDVCFSRIEIAS